MDVIYPYLECDDLHCGFHVYLGPRIWPDMVRYYGYYSNKSRGLRKKAQADDQIATIVPNDTSSRKFRQNWARLIRKIYEVDPLVCPKCNYQMRILSFMEDQAMISKILKHLRLYLVRSTLPARAPTQSPPVR